jgi:ribosomal protein S27E
MKYLRPYYVPVVAKSRDYLMGFLDAARLGAELLYIDFRVLDSTKYNDLLRDGRRRRDMTVEEIVEYENELADNRKIEEKNPLEEDTEEEGEEMQPYLEVDCVCGNSHRFEENFQLPRVNLVCEVCGKILIEYTGHEEAEYEYDGDLEKAFVTANTEDDDEEE